MAKAATAITKTPKTSPFAVGFMDPRKLPTNLGKKGRTLYGWHELTKKGAFKEIPREQVENARTSAASFQNTHPDVKISSMAKTDDDGKIITETIKVEKIEMVDGKEVTKMVDKAVPVSYLFIRTQ